MHGTLSFKKKFVLLFIITMLHYIIPPNHHSEYVRPVNENLELLLFLSSKIVIIVTQIYVLKTCRTS